MSKLTDARGLNMCLAWREHICQCLSLKSQVVSLQTAHSWANAGVLLGDAGVLLGDAGVLLGDACIGSGVAFEAI